LTGPELRIDPLSGLRVIVAAGRGKRPQEFAKKADQPSAQADCPFCPGHEAETPPEIYSLPADSGGGWQVRVVPNKYPALAEAAPTGDVRDPLDPATGRGDPDLFQSAPATGAHEIIVHTPRHVLHLADLDDRELEAAVSVWRARMQAHPDARLRHLSVNEGREGGASREHTHAQLYALGFVPVDAARERERFGAHHTRTMGGCLLCDLSVEETRRRERLVAIDDECLLICPWASRSPFELQIIPRRHQPRFEDDDVGAAMIGRALRLLGDTLGSPPPLNLWVRSAPAGAEHFHWHVDIVPRLTVMAGLELGAGVHLNVEAPERAAASLRAADGAPSE
jgi:UDPglucose--hexose-1-phosphate uridylyltransferase